MKKTIKKLLFILMVFSIQSFLAQGNSIDFTLSSNQVSTNGKTVSLTSSIQKVDNTLIWVQTSTNPNSDYSTLSTSFIIENTGGIRDANTCIGSLNYSLTFDAFQAQFILTGEEGSINATLIITLSHSKQETYHFNVNNITYS